MKGKVQMLYKSQTMTTTIELNIELQFFEYFTDRTRSEWLFSYAVIYDSL